MTYSSVITTGTVLAMLAGCSTEGRPPVVAMAPATSVTIPPSPPPPQARGLATTPAAEPIEPLDEPDDAPHLPLPPIPAPMPTGAPFVPSLGCAPFDRGAAAAALGGVHLAACAQAGGPAGSGHVKIMFDVSGRVSSAVVDGGPFPGTAAGGCIAKQFRTAVIPPFCGAAVAVGKSFSIP